MRAREFTEALNRPYYLHWEHSTDGDVSAVAELPANEGHIHILFEPHRDNKDGSVAWGVEFWRNDSQDITGEGDEFRVFATVLQAVSEFVAKYKPMNLSFQATKKVDQGQKPQSRANLYDTLVQRHARASGYRAFRADAGNNVHYELVKINKGVAEGAEQQYLWHGSRQEISMLEPRQSVDTGGATGSNQNAIYATSDPKVAIAMGLTTPGSDTGMFPNDPQMVLFSGKIRKGEYVYLHKLPFNGPDGKPQFVQGGNSREFHSIPGVEGIKPIEIKEIPVNRYLNLIRKATPADLKLRKKYMKQGVAESATKDFDIDIQDQQWDAIVGYVVNGVKKGMDTDRMELSLYKWASRELVDVEQALEDHGFRDIADLADHIEQHNGRYVPPSDFGLGDLGSKSA